MHHETKRLTNGEEIKKELARKSYKLFSYKAYSQEIAKQ